MKKIILLFIFFTCLVCKVKGEENVATVSVELIPNVYANYSPNSNIKWSGLGYVYINNKLTYCIENNKYIITNNYTVYDDFAVTNLSDNLKKELELISYYGYQYERHNSLYYHMATQELIWNKFGVDIFWTTGSNGNGTIIDITEYKNEIQRLYNNHYLKPSFDETDLNFRVGTNRILIDNNNILSEYEVVYNGENFVKIEDNKLVFQLYKLGPDTIILRRKINNIGDTVVYKANNSQTLVSFGNVKSEDIILNIVVHGGNIYIQTIDPEFSSNITNDKVTLEGAIYGIYNSNDELIVDVLTDQNGVYSANGIPLGDYIIKQFLPSTGYMVNSTEYHTSLKFQDVDKIVNVEAKIIKKVLEITKMYENKGIGILEPEPNINFGIYSNGSLISTITTDSNGYCAAELPYGEYVIKQLNSTEGYEIVEEFRFLVNAEENTTKYTLIDNKIKKYDDIIKDENNIVNIQEENNENIGENIIEKENNLVMENDVVEKLPNLSTNNSICYYFLLIIFFTIIGKYNVQEN